MTRPLRLLSLCVIALALWPIAGPVAQRSDAPPASAPDFAGLIKKLSEPGGEFGGDNLISNEKSYLRVLPALARAQVSGGAYVGVGPDQNFSYIAQVQPAVVFIIDIRRDNLLLHLLFKAIFAESPTRVEYVSALTGRAPPPQPATWTNASIEKIVTYIDTTSIRSVLTRNELRMRLEASLKKTGVPLSVADLARIHEFHNTFIEEGLSLVFQVRGRPPQSTYPSLRDLLRETDGAGHQLSFLATEPGYQILRSLQARDLVIPVVGDVSGPRAMRGIAAEMTARATPLSAFYISNVEQYLYQSGQFETYADNLRRFPRNERSTMIRSVFPSGFRGYLPQQSADSYSTSLTQPLNMMLSDLAAGRYRTYADLVTASAR